jgi:hypothetical protein
MKTILISTLTLALSLGAHAQTQSQSQTPIGTDPQNTSQNRPGVLDGMLRAITGEQDTSTISLDELTRNWNAQARQAAQQMYQRYGAPHEVSANRLVWRNNGGWRATEVINQEVEHNFPAPHHDVLRQTVAMNVPPEKIAELAQFSGSVLVDRTKGEITVRCDSEANNTIALNLANDIVTGRLTADQARSRFTELAQAVQNGQRPTYANGFQFSVSAANTAFPDGPGAQQKQQTWQRIGW